MTDDNLHDVIATVWRRHRATLFERLATIEQAIEALAQDTLTEDARARAYADAHKLAGSLGTFGLAEGTAAAQRLERAFAECDVDLAGVTADARRLRAALESKA